MEDHSETTNNCPKEAMDAFFGMFGQMDIYAKVVIEEILEALIEQK